MFLLAFTSQILPLQIYKVGSKVKEVLLRSSRMAIQRTYRNNKLFKQPLGIVLVQTRFSPIPNRDMYIGNLRQTKTNRLLIPESK